MIVTIHSHTWDQLGLDDPQRYVLALSCFYLGKGIHETMNLLSRDPSDSEVVYVSGTAMYSGMSMKTDFIRKAES